jgi:hypothetical protein
MNLKTAIYSFLIVVFTGVVVAVTTPVIAADLTPQYWIAFGVIVLVVFAVLFILLFTQGLEGETKPDDVRIRRWFVFSYAFMILSIGIAIGPVLVQKDGSDTKNAQKPIALFLIGCSSNENAGSELDCKFKDGNASQEQWIINIGGRVQGCPSGNDSKTFCVKGGLVVPLYFLVLALIGGAVSLTRRVPEYQKRSASSYVGTEKEPKLDPTTVREYLVFQIVQFISAPFIAAVAYYLVGPETPTVGVTVGFTSGFSSEAILLMIRGVMEKVSPGAVKAEQTGAISGVVRSQTQALASVTLAVVGKPNLAAQSDDHGHFVIQSVPAAEQVVEASHQQSGKKMAKVTVDAGKTNPCHIEFP